ncbi:uncharacterized protein GGS22DRAFT_116325 [Annulohypoxylon maeteangense]|uniref:uncharacterized protein n=1 Tax=Annulohypoxylon maeteangense TaxID=1927788 RepID=UPI0020087A14|nr:uncharacterized protein GGS22DRAFT_116325 [Annulohypoxylon maeteangense]KAI0886671.1 hypothetical protein GGS22DRAFT_116325 [Annulohypoxylon maeteangense]
MSDESDIENRVASEEDGSLDEIDSEESGSEDEANGFLDIEASESDGESDNGDNEDGILVDDDDEPLEFHKFMQLPPELRARIWDFFDPDSKEKARVLKVVIPNYTHTVPVIWESEFLEEQTAPSRAMLATHHESREIALRLNPDVFYLRSGGYSIPFNRERDIILLQTDPYNRNNHDIRDILQSLGNPRFVALEANFPLCEDEEEALIYGYEGGPTNILRCIDEYELPAQMMQWCVSDIANTYLVQLKEDFAGIPHYTDTMYCWPDFKTSRELLVEHNILGSDTERQGLEWWPMIEFQNLMRFSKLQTAVATEGEWRDKWDSSSVESEDETEDEYESEGIDDATIDDDEDSSEDEDGLIVVQSNSDSEDDAASTFDGFSPLQIAISEQNGEGIEVGNFSSLEPESPVPGTSADLHAHGLDHDSEQALSDEEPVQKTTRRKRRIISSDDEHDDEDEPNEEVKFPSRPIKRSRVVLSDSEDEDEENEDTKHDQKVVDGSEDGEDSEEQESDESDDEEPEPVKAKPMSLFEKLRQFRDEIPVSPDSGAGSDAGSDADALMDNEDFDEGSESRFLDGEADEDDILDDGEGESQDEGDDEW